MEQQPLLSLKETPENLQQAEDYWHMHSNLVLPTRLKLIKKDLTGLYNSAATATCAIGEEKANKLPVQKAQGLFQ